jgi:hypothetical protein
MEELLSWCIAEQQKLQEQLADVEAAGSPEAATQGEAIRRHLGNLDFIIGRLKHKPPGGPANDP